MTAAKLRPLARELNTCARYLRLADLDDPALVAAMSDYMANIRILLNAAALAELKKEGKCPEETLHRQVKYLNNVIEADHGKLKQLIRPVRGFKTLKTAYATIKGFEVMRPLRKGQASAFNITRDIRGEARIVERAFGLGASALAEAVQFGLEGPAV